MIKRIQVLLIASIGIFNFILMGSVYASCTWQEACGAGAYNSSYNFCEPPAQGSLCASGYIPTYHPLIGTGVSYFSNGYSAFDAGGGPSPGSWVASCSKNGCGSNCAFYATNCGATCYYSSSTTLFAEPSANQRCKVGTPSSVTTNGTNYLWTCSVSSSWATARDYANQVLGISTRVSTINCSAKKYVACSYTNCGDWGSCQPGGYRTRTCTVSNSPCYNEQASQTQQENCTYTTPTAPTCTSATCNSWTACNSNSTKSCTSVSLSPSGCSGGITTVADQSCIYTPNTCSATCNSWSACRSDSLQSCTSVSLSPSGCSGGITTIADKSCIYTPTVSSCSWSCGNWSSCQVNGMRTRACTRTNEPCIGENPYSISESCTYSPECEWSCSGWGTCNNGTRSRNCSRINYPCTASTSPSLSETCTLDYCSWSCSGWSECTNSKRTRNCWIANSPCSNTTLPFATEESCVSVTNGECGTSSGQVLSSAPTINLCSDGNPTTVYGTGPWMWNCVGINGGQTKGCYASISVTSGVCGSSNGGSFTSMPSANLCDSGILASSSSIDTMFFWVCNGSNGGNSIGCSANRVYLINGACGSANANGFASAPTSGLCSSGTASSVVTNTTTYNWTCTGASGGTSSSCASTRLFPVNGACGSSNGQTIASAPTGTAACAAGTTSAVATFSSSYSWTCLGVDGGTSTACLANRTPGVGDGVCGYANGKSLSSVPTQAVCTAGTATQVVSYTGSQLMSWTCVGNGGLTDSCSAQRTRGSNWKGACNSTVHGKFYTSTPADSSLCYIGTPINKVLKDSVLNWQCSDAGATPATYCWAYQKINGACGTARGGSFTDAPQGNLCSAGFVFKFPGKDENSIFATGDLTKWNWECVGQGGTNESCSANKIFTASTGKCGSAAGKNYSTVPVSGLCDNGNPTTVKEDSVRFTWICTGVSGAKNAYCRANKTGVYDAVCGSAEGKSYNTTPPVGERCAQGSSGSIYNFGGSWYWTCNAGGYSAICWSGAKTDNPSPETYDYNGGMTNYQIVDTWPTSGDCVFGSNISGTGNIWNQDLGTAKITRCNDEYQPVGTSQSSNMIFKPATGGCGTANGTYVSSVPTANHCTAASGNSGIAIEGAYFNDAEKKWHWRCGGWGLGPVVADCAAYQITNGLCGSANEATLSEIPSESALCSIGTASIVIDTGTAYTWNCGGINTGASTPCTATKSIAVMDIKCGSAATPSYIKPTANFCSAGVASVVATNADDWSWTCTEGVNVANCSAKIKLDGICGSASGGEVLTIPTTNLCSDSSLPTVYGEGPWLWACSGKNGGDNSACFANQPISISTNGLCGSANEKSFYSKPITELCSDGSSPEVLGTGPWTWTCLGSNGGESVGCSATKETGSEIFNMLNPDEFNPEQCVWCEMYYDVLDTSKINPKQGMKGSGVTIPKFRFNYIDPSGKNAASYIFAMELVSSGNNNPDIASIKIANNILLGDVQVNTFTVTPGITVNRFPSISNQIGYGKNYKWWVRVKNSDGIFSAWSSPKTFQTADHEWPKVRVTREGEGSMIANTEYQFCSTMRSLTDKSDPCYNICWSDAANNTNPVLEDSRWLCSVCYDLSGNAILCQNSTQDIGASNRFEWSAEGSNFPIKTNPSTNTPNAFNMQSPLIKFPIISNSIKINLTIRGSECPFAYDTKAKKPLPVWIEK